jgi:DNA-binding response OmpR family regulator
MGHPVYVFDGWRVDTGRRTAFKPNGDPVHLTDGEYQLLVFLAQRPQRRIERAEFAADNHGKGGSLDVKILRLRRKIESMMTAPVYIKTLRASGRSAGAFYFASPVELLA